MFAFIVNPRALLGLLESPILRRVTPIVGTAVQVVAADPERICFQVFPTVPTVGALRLIPYSGMTGGVTPMSGEEHVTISVERYPLLCQQAWFINATTPGPSDVFVAEIRRTPRSS